MGRLLTITQSNNLQPGVQKRTFSPQIKIGPVSLTFINIILICLLALLYLIQSNQLLTKGYKIKQLEEKKLEILSENEDLQVEATRLQSIKEIETGIGESQMEPTKKINYLTNSSKIASNK